MISILLVGLNPTFPKLCYEKLLEGTNPRKWHNERGPNPILLSHPRIPIWIFYIGLVSDTLWSIGKDLPLEFFCADVFFSDLL